MSKSLQRDFTQGSIPQHLIKFALPMFAGNLLQVLYNTVDSIWVGHFVGKEALGAVSISFSLIFALLSLIFGVTMATTTLVAQYRGAGNEPMVRKSISNSLMLLGIGGTVVSFAGYIFRYPLLRLINTPAGIIDPAASYLGIFLAGMLGMFLYNTLGAILRGLGDSKTPLKFMVISTVLNIALDPLLILGIGPLPQMGVAGAALATVISQGVASVLLLRWVVKNTDLLKLDLSYWKFESKLVKQILRIGLPSGLQQSLVSFGMVVVLSIINGFGDEVVAAYGAAQRLDQLAWMPAMSIGLAVTSLVGQNLGAGKHERVRETVLWSSLFTVALTAIVSVIALVKPTILMVLFTTDEGVLAAGSVYLRYMGLAYIPFALLFVLGGVMRGAGDTMPAMIFTLIALWGLRVPLATWLSKSMGVEGIWLGIALSACAGLLLHWGYYLSGRWKRRVVARPAGPVGPSADTAAASGD